MLCICNSVFSVFSQHHIETRVTQGTSDIDTNNSSSSSRSIVENSSEEETALVLQDPIGILLPNTEHPSDLISEPNHNRSPLNSLSTPRSMSNDVSTMNTVLDLVLRSLSAIIHVMFSSGRVFFQNLLHTEAEPASASSSSSHREVEADQVPVSDPDADPEAGPSIQNFGSSTDSMSDQGVYS